MSDRTGWHCLDCNRYFQTHSADPPPTRCAVCGASSSLREIPHEHATELSVSAGDVVVCERVGVELTYVIGRVRTQSPDRIIVDALDGSGTYTVKPAQVIGIRADSAPDTDA